MKKIYSLACAVLLSASVWAQSVTQEVPMMPRPVDQHELQLAREAKLEQQPLQYEVARGSEFFYENFSNGFDGSTVFGAWTHEDNGVDADVWMMATAASPGGQFSTTIDPLASESAGDGWVIFDSDLHNSPDQLNFDLWGYLTSPVMDMSELETVVIEWQQYFRYCCWSYSPFGLEVTNDGGETWYDYPAHGTFIPSANTVSANPLTTQVDITCAAAGFSEVQIRFAWASPADPGFGYYFWGIDDVRIFENPYVDNLEIAQVVNGDVFNIWEYRTTPMEQAPSEADGGLLVGTVVKNIGSADQLDAVLTIEVRDDMDNVVSTTVTDPFDIPAYGNQGVCPQQVSDTLYIQTGWVPSAEGSYTVTSSIVSASTDETPETNTMEKVITYTADEYGHDDPEALDVQIQAREAPNGSTSTYDPTGYGTWYSCPNEGSEAFGVLVRFGNASDEGCEFDVRLYEGDNGSNPYDPNAALNVCYNYFTLGQEWIDNSQNDYVYFPFEEEYEMMPTNIENGDFGFYFAAVMEEFGSDFQLSCLAESNSDNDNSTLQFERSGSNTFVWFGSQTYHPAVRLVVSNRVGVNELQTATDFELGQNMPNPAGEMTRIPLTLHNAHNVALEIRDMSGKLVKWESYGTFAAGEHTLEVSTADMAAGTYTYAVVAGTERLSRQMVVAGK